MSKLKTKKSAVKRFKVTKNGKVLRGRQMGSHLKLAKVKAKKEGRPVSAKPKTTMHAEFAA